MRRGALGRRCQFGFSSLVRNSNGAFKLERPLQASIVNARVERAELKGKLRGRRTRADTSEPRVFERDVRRVVRVTTSRLRVEDIFQHAPTPGAPSAHKALAR